MKRTSKMSAAIHGTTLSRGACLLGLISILLAASGCGGAGTDPVGAGPSGPGVAALSWAKPTTNDDGSPMTNLAGYQIYYAQETPVTPANSEIISVLNPNQTAFQVADLTPGTYYFTVTAVNLGGAESSMSNEAIKTIL
jgi:hypothetical protein